MISTMLDIFLFTMVACITVILVSVTIVFLKDIKDDMR